MTFFLLSDDTRTARGAESLYYSIIFLDFYFQYNFEIITIFLLNNEAGFSHIITCP